MNLAIAPSNNKTIFDLAKLLAEYQVFYGAKPDKDHNLNFLKKFINSNEGVFFIAKDETGFIGYSSLYFSYSSVSARPIAILNDLYVNPDARNKGCGQKLIDYSITYAKELGMNQVRWCTPIQNEQAQKLYAKYHANQTHWFHYDLDAS